MAYSLDGAMFSIYLIVEYESTSFAHVTQSDTYVTLMHFYKIFDVSLSYTLRAIRVRSGIVSSIYE